MPFVADPPVRPVGRFVPDAPSPGAIPIQGATATADNLQMALPTGDPMLEAMRGVMAGQPFSGPKTPSALTSVVLRGGGAIGGQALGALVAPETLGLSIPIGGAIGGGLSSYADQKRKVAAGEQSGIHWGELLSDIGTGAIPGASLESQGAKAITKEALKQGAAGALAKTVQTEVDERRLPNATEYALASGIPAIGGAVAQKLQAANPEIQSAVADAAKIGATKRAVLASAQDAGYAVPPASVNPSTLNKTLTSVAGKAATNQQATIGNQEITNALAKKTLGLPNSEDITVKALNDFRSNVAKPYAEVAALSSQAKDDLEALKQARFDANAYRTHYFRSADPASLKLADTNANLAATLETSLENAAKAAKKPDLVDALRDARKKIAQSYDLERALNPATGDIDAKSLSRSFDNGKPLSGGLETTGAFALGPGKSVTAEASGIPTPGVSKLGAIGALLAGATVAGSTHSPSYGLLTAAAPLISSPVRSLILSSPYQRVFAQLPTAAVKATPDALALAIRQTGQTVGKQTATQLTEEDVRRLFPVSLPLAQ